MVAHELHIIISITCAPAAEEGSGVGYVSDRAVSQRHALGLWRDDRPEENDTSSSLSRRPGIGSVSEGSDPCCSPSCAVLFPLEESSCRNSVTTSIPRWCS